MARSRPSSTIRRTARITHGFEEMLDLVLRDETVPAIQLAPDGKGPVPAVLLLHGFSSSKERMAQTVGRQLLAHGVASLALDLPYHGERGKASGDLPRNPLLLVRAWRSAVGEVRAAVDWLTKQPECDASRIGVLGYSLGGFLALMSAADDPRLCVVGLAAAGDLPDHTPYTKLLRSAIDPLRAARRLAGRPLLLVNGRRDTTTRPAQAERLFAAASEPKTLIWYDGGHWPPIGTVEATVTWMASRLSGRAVDGERAS